MNRAYFIYFVLLFVTCEVTAQEEKSFSAGIIFSPSLAVTANTSLDIYQNNVLGFIHSNKNKYFLGIGFYENAIQGFDCGYQYHILNSEKKNHWYAEADLRYVRYGTGYANPVSLNYFKPLTSYCDANTIHANADLVSSFSFGRSLFLNDTFHFTISLGSGITWREKKIVDCLQIAYGDKTSNSFSPNFMLKLGLGINVYKKVKQ
ncbi:MAG TPA: hypothetical protein VI757_15375 [Bacteroidia bacterium]|nr:hypothetical protein [Bacteroidia bacterium]